MMSWNFDLLAAEYILATLILLCSLSSIWSIITGRWRVVKNPNHAETFYEDEDGAATAESTKEFSNKLQFTIIYAIAFIGFALSIADLITLLVLSRTPQGSFSDITAESNAHGIVLLVPAWVRIRHSMSIILTPILTAS